MPIAFVLIKTETGSEDEVLQSLKKVDHAVEAYAVYSGAYEIVAKIQSTMTMIVTEETPS
jgi:hypothetical protein